MGTPYEKLPHSCGSRKGLQVFVHEDGSVDGFCFACETPVPDPYGDGRGVKDLKVKVKTPEEIQEEIREISGYPIMDWPKRKLKKVALDYYNIKIGLSEEDGVTPQTMYFPYTKNGEITGYKVEFLTETANNKRFTIGDVKGCELFGWKQAIATGSKRLYITEGEKDAVSLKQVIERLSKEEFKGTAAVVSLTKGAGNARADISRMLTEIKGRFKEVVLVFDMDEAGRKAVEDVCTILPTALVAKLPEKDSNECLLQGKEKALYNATVFNATLPKNTRLVFGEDLHEAARKPAEWGSITLPWAHINQVTRNVRLGETWYWGAGVDFCAI